MKKFLANLSRHLSNPVHSFRRRPAPRRAAGFRPHLEALEARQLLSTTSMEAVAAQFLPHAGPTRLYLNFDGDGNQNGLAKSDTDYQDILFRTAERFAPFNVEVLRALGHGNAGNDN